MELKTNGEIAGLRAARRSNARWEGKAMVSDPETAKIATTSRAIRTIQGRRPVGSGSKRLACISFSTLDVTRLIIEKGS